LSHDLSLRLASLLVLSLLVMSSPAGALTTGGQSSSQGNLRMGGFPSTSWALGVVVPQGAGLGGGGSLRWEEVTNLTCLATLPFVSDPGGIVYAVLSAMAGDGAVMQVAAGIYPNSTLWRAFSWYVEGVQSSQPSYRWILNSSGPAMSPDDRITLSIYRSSDHWNLSVIDTSTGGAVVGSFPSGSQSSLKVGDQEVFALESYSRDAGDFAQMGNLTLDGVYAGGARVSSGFYVYGSWDPTHNPVFVVGSSGTSPPIFISITPESGGAFAWSYSDPWSGYVSPVGPGPLATVLVVAVAVAVASVWVAFRIVRAPRNSIGTNPRERRSPR
jgi:hypothetical protein